MFEHTTRPNSNKENDDGEAGIGFDCGAAD